MPANNWAIDFFHLTGYLKKEFMAEDSFSPENTIRFLGFFQYKICLISKTNITPVFAGRTMCFYITYKYDYHMN